MDTRWLLRAAYPWARRFWRLTRPLTLGARALVVVDGQVLLVRHSYGEQWQWTLPGGAVAKGETVVDAALRELAEECGVGARAAEPPLLGVYFSTAEGKQDHIAVIVCQAQRVEPRAGGPEIDEAAWHPLDRLPPISPGVARCLRDFARGARGQVGPW